MAPIIIFLVILLICHIMLSKMKFGRYIYATGGNIKAAEASGVIGGTSMTGGIGTIPGTLVGILIIGTLNNSLNLLNVSSYYQQIIKGIIILGAVCFDIVSKKNSK